jgi:hypothetical protein
MISHIFVNVIQQQTLNRDQWGGPSVDDTREPAAWLQFIDHQLDRALEDISNGQDERAVVYARLTKIASLCFDGMESMDRKEAKRDKQPAV